MAEKIVFYISFCEMRFSCGKQVYKHTEYVRRSSRYRLTPREWRSRVCVCCVLLFFFTHEHTHAHTPAHTHTHTHTHELSAFVLIDGVVQQRCVAVFRGVPWHAPFTEMTAAQVSILL